MKVRKSATITDFYYIIGDSHIRAEGQLADFSDVGDIKLGIFNSDTHLYPEQLLDVLYIRGAFMWTPLFFNGVLCK